MNSNCDVCVHDIIFDGDTILITTIIYVDIFDPDNSMQTLNPFDILVIMNNTRPIFERRSRHFSIKQVRLTEEVETEEEEKKLIEYFLPIFAGCVIGGVVASFVIGSLIWICVMNCARLVSL